MGYIALIPIAVGLLIAGIVAEKEKLYMFSAIFWFILGIYCFSTLAGVNPVTVWNGWLGIASIMGSLYIMYDLFFSEFNLKGEEKRPRPEVGEFGEEINSNNHRQRAVRIHKRRQAADKEKSRKEIGKILRGEK